VSPVKYKLGFYIPQDDILRSHHRENLKSYIALTGWALERRHNVSPVKYELGFYIPEDGILHLQSIHRTGYRRSKALGSYSGNVRLNPRLRPSGILLTSVTFTSDGIEANSQTISTLD
jgi:hypothetical protein